MPDASLTPPTHPEGSATPDPTSPPGPAARSKPAPRAHRITSTSATRTKLNQPNMSASRFVICIIRPPRLPPRIDIQKRSSDRLCLPPISVQFVLLLMHFISPSLTHFLRPSSRLRHCNPFTSQPPSDSNDVWGRLGSAPCAGVAVAQARRGTNRSIAYSRPRNRQRNTHEHGAERGDRSGVAHATYSRAV